jgi:ABC-type lipoprotein release transport system permease subunit
MLTWRIAVRNIFRQKRRTTLTMLTMFGGFTLAAISIAWADGTYNSIIDLFTRNQLGHIQIHREGYLDRPSLYKTIDDYEVIGRKIESLPGLETWTPRLYAAGLVSVGEKSAVARLIGIEPAREDIATRFTNKITNGRAFSHTPAHEAILGQGLATVLNAGVGDSVVVVSQGADGSIANDLYAIIGLIESGNKMSDRAALYLHLADAQELLVLDGRIHEIVVIANRLNGVSDLTGQIKTTLADPRLAVAPWQEFAKSFYVAMKADKRGNWVSLFVIVLIVAIGVLNTVLMTVMERRREYGLLRALGTRPGQIVRMVLSETFIMAVASVIIGVAVSLVVNYLLSLKGISMPQPITYGGIEFTTMKTEINARSLYIPGITVIIVAVLVSIYPALRAAHIAPARVMRMH